MAGNVGEAMIFMMMLMLATIIGGLATAFGTHTLTVVVEQTASGAEEIAWPDEPITEWLGKIFFGLFLGGLLALPGAAVAAALSVVLPRPAAVAVAAGLMVWAALPPMVLSAMLGTSRFAVFSPYLTGRAALRLPDVVTFYFLSVPVVLAGAAAGWALWTFAPLGAVLAPLAAASLLWHARLMGRLGERLTYEPPAPREKADDPVTAPRVAAEEPAAPQPKPAKPLKRKVVWQDRDDDGKVYDLDERPESAPASPAAAALAQTISPEQLERETKLQGGGRKKKKKKGQRRGPGPWLAGLAVFPVNGGVSTALVALSAALVVMSVCFALMKSSTVAG